MGFYFVHSCPDCQHPFDADFGLTSGLGPPARVCTRCGSVIATEREEWDDATSWGKVRYLAMSAAYIAAGGFLGRICIRGAYHLWSSPDTSKMSLDGPGATLGALLGVLLVTLVQVSRVMASRKRTVGPRRRPFVPPALNLQVGVMMKVLVLFLSLPLLAWLARKALGGP